MSHKTHIRSSDVIGLEVCNKKGCKCDLVHCPFCDLKHFKPAKHVRTRDHLDKTHFAHAVYYNDLVIVKCFHECHDKTECHYHCPVCPQLILKRVAFTRHMKSHAKKLGQDVCVVSAPDSKYPDKIQVSGLELQLCKCGVVAQKHYHCSLCGKITYVRHEAVNHTWRCVESRDLNAAASGNGDVDKLSALYSHNSHVPHAQEVFGDKWHLSIVRNLQDVPIHNTSVEQVDNTMLQCALCDSKKPTFCDNEQALAEHHLAHWKSRVLFKDYAILWCCRKCEIDANLSTYLRRHYHCPLCGLTQGRRLFVEHLRRCTLKAADGDRNMSMTFTNDGCVELEVANSDTDVAEHQTQLTPNRSPKKIGVAPSVKFTVVNQEHYTIEKGKVLLAVGTEPNLTGPVGDILENGERLTDKIEESSSVPLVETEAVNCSGHVPDFGTHAPSIVVTEPTEEIQSMNHKRHDEECVSDLDDSELFDISTAVISKKLIRLLATETDVKSVLNMVTKETRTKWTMSQADVDPVYTLIGPLESLVVAKKLLTKVVKAKVQEVRGRDKQEIFPNQSSEIRSETPQSVQVQNSGAVLICTDQNDVSRTGQKSTEIIEQFEDNAVDVQIIELSAQEKRELTQGHLDINLLAPKSLKKMEINVNRHRIEEDGQLEMNGQVDGTDSLRRSSRYLMRGHGDGKSCVGSCTTRGRGRLKKAESTLSETKSGKSETTAKGNKTSVSRSKRTAVRPVQDNVLFECKDAESRAKKVKKNNIASLLVDSGHGSSENDSSALTPANTTLNTVPSRHYSTRGIKVDFSLLNSGKKSPANKVNLKLADPNISSSKSLKDHKRKVKTEMTESSSEMKKTRQRRLKDVDDSKATDLLETEERERLDESEMTTDCSVQADLDLEPDHSSEDESEGSDQRKPGVKSQQSHAINTTCVEKTAKAISETVTQPTGKQVCSRKEEQQRLGKVSSDVLGCNSEQIETDKENVTAPKRKGSVDEQKEVLKSVNITPAVFVPCVIVPEEVRVRGDLVRRKRTIASRPPMREESIVQTGFAKPSEMQFKCSICSFLTVEFLALREHKECAHGMKNIVQCDVCECCFQTNRGLELHLIKKHRPFPEPGSFPCEFCDQIYKYSSQLKWHNNYKHKEQTQKPKKPKFECDKCNFHANTAQDFYNHKALEHGEELKCQICGKSFSKGSYLNNHIQCVHSKVKQAICNVCGKAFNNVRYLNSHIKRHEGIKKFACTLCGYKTYEATLLKSHMESHKMEEERSFKYVCSYCGKRYLGKQNYLDHLNKHTGEKPYSCNFCDKRFGFRSMLIKHKIYIHSTQRPFKCPNCEKAFKFERLLKNHIVTHTGQSQFVCRMCNKAFSTKNSLKVHKPKCKGLNWHRPLPSVVSLTGCPMDPHKTFIVLPDKPNSVQEVTIGQLTADGQVVLNSMEPQNLSVLNVPNSVLNPESNCIEGSQMAKLEPINVERMGLMEGDLPIHHTEELPVNETRSAGQETLQRERDTPSRAETLSSQDITLPLMNPSVQLHADITTEPEDTSEGVLTIDTGDVIVDDARCVTDTNDAADATTMADTNLVADADSISDTGVAKLTPESSGGVMYVCSECSESFSTFEQAERHVLLRHVEQIKMDVNPGNEPAVPDVGETTVAGLQEGRHELQVEAGSFVQFQDGQLVKISGSNDIERMDTS